MYRHKQQYPIVGRYIEINIPWNEAFHLKKIIRAEERNDFCILNLTIYKHFGCHRCIIMYINVHIPYLCLSIYKIIQNATHTRYL